MRVKVVPDFTQLGQLMESKADLKRQIRHYKELNKGSSTRLQVKIKKDKQPS